ncbi:MAG: ABC transporter ATP-binding protein [Bacillota bacterium]
MILEVKDVACGYGQKVVLDHVSFSAKKSQVICILGPNGVGKTTVFKTIMGLLKPLSGQILLNGTDRTSMSVMEIARMIAYVPQHHTPPFPFLVREVVATGRTAHIGRFASPGKRDEAIVERVLDSMHLSHLSDRVYTELSGGERQMVLIARALAQEPQIMILDEPTSNLDFGNQIKVLQKINRLSHEGLCIIMTTHFPDHAFLCNAEVLLFQKEKQYMMGCNNEIITEKNVWDAYGIHSRITEVYDDSGQSVRTCVPLAN